MLGNTFVSINATEVNQYNPQQIYVYLGQLANDDQLVTDDGRHVPAHYVYFTESGQLKMDMLGNPPNSVSRKDLNPNGYYTTGGSLVAECQYTLGASAEDEARGGMMMDLMLRDAGEGRSLHWRMNLYHGHIDNQLRLKCVTKIYDHTEVQDQWRSWDDVWRSF